MFAPLDASVKISTLRLSNRADRRRRVSVTTYNELALGVSREKSAPFIVTERDNDPGEFSRAMLTTTSLRIAWFSGDESGSRERIL